MFQGRRGRRINLAVVRRRRRLSLPGRAAHVAAPPPAPCRRRRRRPQRHLRRRCHRCRRRRPSRHSSGTPPRARPPPSSPPRCQRYFKVLVGCVRAELAPVPLVHLIHVQIVRHALRLAHRALGALHRRAGRVDHARAVRAAGPRTQSDKI